MGFKTILLEKFWIKSSIIDETKVKRHLEMMNNLTSMKVA